MGTAIVVVIMVMGCLQLPAELLSEEIDGAEHEQMSMLLEVAPFRGHHASTIQSTTKVRQRSMLTFGSIKPCIFFSGV